MSVTGLKPPPKFVKNEYAWSYTLNKLKAKDGLDEDGNPRNYGAAIAIYKRVVAKYGNDLAELPVIDDVGTWSREALVHADEADAWFVSRGVCWSATDSAQQTISYDPASHEANGQGEGIRIIRPLHSLILSRYLDDARHVMRIPVETAMWLVRESPAGQAYVRGRSEEMLQDLDEMAADVKAAREDCERGDTSVTAVCDHTISCAFFDFVETQRLVDEHRSELEQALSHT